MTEDPNIVEAILGALKFTNATPERLLTLSDSEWEELLLYADLSHVTFALAMQCPGFLPDWVRTRINRNLSDNRARVDLIRSEYLEIETAFASSGVEYVVLKGFAQCPEYSPRLETRFQSDIDLFCPVTSQTGAVKALEQLGYYALPTPETADHLPVMVRRSGWRWRGNMYDPQMPPSIELHHRLWNINQMRFGPKRLESFWFRRTTQRAEGLSFPGLNSVDNLGFSALQVLRDLLGFILLAHKVYELAYFLHRNSTNKMFWSEWRTTHDDDLRMCQAISFCLAKACFGCELAPEATQEIDRLPASVVNWVATYGPMSLKTYRTLNKNAVWLHIALVNSLHDRLAVLMRMFPKPPEVRKVMANTGHCPSDVPTWKQRARYLIYCLYRAPQHAFLILLTLMSGLRIIMLKMPFFRRATKRPDESVRRAEVAELSQGPGR